MMIFYSREKKQQSMIDQNIGEKRKEKREQQITLKQRKKQKTENNLYKLENLSEF